jgi:hypothetical protein
MLLRVLQIEVERSYQQKTLKENATAEERKKWNKAASERRRKKKKSVVSALRQLHAVEGEISEGDVASAAE